MKHQYEVIVGNIGTVYSGEDRLEASQHYAMYRQRSIDGVGRAAGESVTMFTMGEITARHDGTQDEYNEYDDIP